MPQNDGGYEQYVCCMDYSHTNFKGGWAILSKVNSGRSNTDYVRSIFQIDVVHAICVAAICTFGYAIVIWLLERSQSGMHPEFGDREYFEPKFVDGLRTGICHTNFKGGWAILSKVNSGRSNTDYVRSIFQIDVVHAICVAAICTFGYAILIWLLERSQSGMHPEFGDREYFEPKFVDGLRTGMWFGSNAIMNGVIASEKVLTA
ncbi:uncharacterized protein HaLaN_12418 [Haematococcus lacustris]|uniref:Uncharacterized protein n=1 Tax=Haematococcus lacustris TaxID=44745 RepID=A0A699ZA15_HAELA|nr:uncharacterized protein HaLaN_12418 [Haematococcus lacustris]